jgi:competence ComEA-like helix-hairpin-helix protein
LNKATTPHFDLRIAVVVVLFLGVCVASGLKGYGVTGSSSAKPMCQQLDLSSSHLVSVDCDVIVNAPVENGRSPNMAVFSFDPISVNQASYELLQTVKGVGPKLAQQIITYRSEVGPFKGIESIKKLTGVGDKRAQYLATQFSFN